MSAEKDISLDEKRVYEGDQREREAFVACAMGIVRVEVVDERVGTFSLAHRCDARDVAAGDGGRIAVATDEDVLLAGGTGSDEGDGESPDFVETGFGPAVAVGFDGYDLLAASEDGLVARLRGAVTRDDWAEVGALDYDVRAIDGDLVAAADGVYRVSGELDHVGLDDARDVSAVGTPWAATGTGLYYLGNGWMDALDGEFTLVSGDGERRHAASRETLYEHVDGDWREATTQPEHPLAGLASGETTYAVTPGGEFLAEADDGWRVQVLGMPDVTGLVVRQA
ncbi:HVO_0234 family beta-propeller protein [Haloarchaeobius sp. DFWS5]|uniref:HVO_0234 family beta-propeller protein n=1 Tax=Haloarchaeobius sp. DFWS5 TaxID=3446114 RepID=UPI003EB82B1F